MCKFDTTVGQVSLTPDLAADRIYWRDGHLKFHEYESMRPTKNVQALLDYIETSGDPIFRGSRSGLSSTPVLGSGATA